MVAYFQTQTKLISSYTHTITTLRTFVSSSVALVRLRTAFTRMPKTVVEIYFKLPVAITRKTDCW